MTLFDKSWSFVLAMRGVGGDEDSSWLCPSSMLLCEQLSHFWSCTGTAPHSRSSEQSGSQSMRSALSGDAPPPSSASGQVSPWALRGRLPGHPGEPAMEALEKLEGTWTLGDLGRLTARYASFLLHPSLCVAWVVCITTPYDLCYCLCACATHSSHLVRPCDRLSCLATGSNSCTCLCACRPGV